MTKERLERMMQYYSRMESAPLEIQEDMGWVLNYAKEKAERVQELEGKLIEAKGDYDYLSYHYGNETEQNKRYRKIIENVELAAQINGYDDIYNFIVKELECESDE